jgi:hypothetical protein
MQRKLLRKLFWWGALLWGCSFTLSSTSSKKGGGGSQPFDSLQLGDEPVMLREMEGRYNCAYDPESQSLLYAKTPNPSGQGTPLLESPFLQGQWEPFKKVPMSEHYYNLDPFVAAEGKQLFFISFRPPAWNMDIWISKKGNSGWQPPVILGKTVNTDQIERSPTVAANGYLYFLRGDTIYRSAWRNEAYAQASPLPGGVNDGMQISDACISPDEKYLVFSSHRSGGFSPEDFYISLNRGGNWSAGKNLGPRINSFAHAGSPRITLDGKYLYFSGVREGKTGIFVVETRILLKDSPSESSSAK